VIASIKYVGTIAIERRRGVVLHGGGVVANIGAAGGPCPWAGVSIAMGRRGIGCCRLHAIDVEADGEPQIAYVCERKSTTWIVWRLKRKMRLRGRRDGNRSIIYLLKIIYLKHILK
jgi:hypothetical protein